MGVHGKVQSVITLLCSAVAAGIDIGEEVKLTTNPKRQQPVSRISILIYEGGL
jgi:hypothetical protein